MPHKIDLTEALLSAWKTTHQTSAFLIKNIPAELWNEKIPGYPRKTFGMLAVHLHNSRCMWIISIIKGKHGKTLVRLNSKRGTRKELMSALNQSNEAMLKLLRSCIENGGQLPSKPAWLNFPNDVMHLLSYFVAHEAHHRGQMIMAARQLNQHLPLEVTAGVWQWTKRLKEVTGNKN